MRGARKRKRAFLKLVILRGIIGIAALQEMRRLAVTDGELGSLATARLSMHYRQWPRAWQTQPWCAGRTEGGQVILRQPPALLACCCAWWRSRLSTLKHTRLLAATLRAKLN